MHGRKAHFGAVAYKGDRKRGFKPYRVQRTGVGAQGVVQQRQVCRAYGRRYKEISEQCQRNAHRAEHHVFPCGFQLARHMVKADKRHAGKSGGLQRHPHKSQMAAYAHKTHCRQEKQHERRKYRLGLGAEQRGENVAAFAVRFISQITARVKRGRREQYAGDKQEKLPRAVQRKPVTGLRRENAQHYRQGQLGAGGGSQNEFRVALACQ